MKQLFCLLEVPQGHLPLNSMMSLPICTFKFTSLLFYGSGVLCPAETFFQFWCVFLFSNIFVFNPSGICSGLRCVGHSGCHAQGLDIDQWVTERILNISQPTKRSSLRAGSTSCCISVLWFANEPTDGREGGPRARPLQKP